MIKDQTVNSLGFVDHKFSVATTQLCPCNIKVAQTICKQVNATVFQTIFIFKNKL